jgi:hypothetical protein
LARPRLLRLTCTPMRAATRWIITLRLLVERRGNVWVAAFLREPEILFLAPSRRS